MNTSGETDEGVVSAARSEICVNLKQTYCTRPGLLDVTRNIQHNASKREAIQAYTLFAQSA